MNEKLAGGPVRLFGLAALFLIGAFGYGAIEILWRGYTHWTMLFAGGTCFTIYYKLCEDEKNMPLFAKCFFGALIITCVELMFGTVVNVLLNWNVWDYSNIPLNFFGQICLPFFVLWFLLCVPITALCNGICKWMA
ncbi:putative ABC transporter permease [Congzhengia minquanensis]|uniref:ABC-transporter type IV n=1 Tax=Congzhengia minquanensis TaxID=2763657 RepID=A0A926DM70_9FIRM|nr:hypothetical protein [Congzhengia minquanensis]MBC8540277.1 hypothetical protein [Congzhengia minquanensis]